MNQYSVTVEYTVLASNETEARETNFWCNELQDEGMIVGVDDLAQPTPAKPHPSVSDPDLWQCCHIPCGKPASWEARWEPGAPGDYAHACDDHLGHSIGRDEWPAAVFRLEHPDGRTSSAAPPSDKARSDMTEETQP